MVRQRYRIQLDVRYSFNLEYLIRGVTHDKSNTGTSGDGDSRMDVWDEKEEEEGTI